MRFVAIDRDPTGITRIIDGSSHRQQSGADNDTSGKKGFFKKLISSERKTGKFERNPVDLHHAYNQKIVKPVAYAVEDSLADLDQILASEKNA